MADVMIDTNIWCYYFDETTAEHNQIINYLDEVLDERSIGINVIILMECSHYLIKNLGPVIGKEHIYNLINSGIEIDELGLIDTKKSIDELSKYSHFGIGGRDATILMSMKKLKVKELITHDKSFSKVPEITVIDPIKDV